MSLCEKHQDPEHLMLIVESSNSLKSKNYSLIVKHQKLYQKLLTPEGLTEDEKNKLREINKALAST